MTTAPKPPENSVPTAGAVSSGWKTTCIIIGAAVVLGGVAFGGYYFGHSGKSEEPASNTSNLSTLSAQPPPSGATFVPTASTTVQDSGPMGDQASSPSADAPPPPNGAVPGDNAPDAGANSGQGVSYQTFYDNLNSQGHWIQSADYGYVFQPTVSDPDWAPYTDGSWAYTDIGWYWNSAEPWAWATYHYGRWDYLDGVGWAWAPGYEWAPAWVSWRYGNGYAGWAPLPYGAVWGYRYGYGRDYRYWGDRGHWGEHGYHFGHDVDGRYHIGADRYHFVRSEHLGDHNLRGSILDRHGNAGYVSHTANITNLNVGKNVGAQGGDERFRGVSAGGPPINEVNAHAANEVPSMHLSPANTPGHSGVSGNSLAVYAPRVNDASARQARPAEVNRSIGSAGGAAGKSFGAENHEVSGFHPETAGGPGATNFHPQDHTVGETGHTDGAGGTNFHPVDHNVGEAEHHAAGGASGYHPAGGTPGYHPAAQTHIAPAQHPAGVSQFHPQPHPSGGGGGHPSGGGGGGGAKKK